MGKTNKEKRARKAKERRKRRASRSEQPAGLFEPDPDSGGRYLKQPGIRYANEPDIAIKCPSCQHVRYTPVHATIIRPEQGGSDVEVQAFDSICPECGFRIALEPRLEVEADGTALFWVDRSVAEEYEGEEVHQLVLESRESGARIAVTQGSSDYEFWAVCRDCGNPFPSRGSLAFTVALTEDEGPPDSEVAFCPECGGFGSALLSRFVAGDVVTYANSPGFAETVAETIADQVAAGEIDLAMAIHRLRQSSDPRVRRIADWLEERPVSTMIAVSILQTVVTLFGPSLLRADEPVPVPQPSPASTFTEEQVDRIIDSVLDHYDEQLLAKGDRSKPPGGIDGKRKNGR